MTEAAQDSAPNYVPCVEYGGVMTDTPAQNPAGWYQDPARGNEVHYWNGTAWAGALVESLERKESEKAAKAAGRHLANTKLATIGHFAWITAALGIIILIVSGGSFDAMPVVIAFISFGVGLWMTWLAVGAIVDAINNRR